VELPRLEPIYQKYKDQGFRVVAIESQRDTEAARKFIEENQLTYTFLEDREADDQKVVPKLTTGSFPTSYLINREGKVIFAHVGFDEGDEEKIEKEVVKLL